MRQRMQQQQQASAKNQRLALQMANRPAVQAALKLKKVRAFVYPQQQQQNSKKNRSILFLFRKAYSSAWACSRGWVCVDAAGECEAEDGADSEAQVAVRWIEEMARFKTTEVGSEEIFA